MRILQVIPSLSLRTGGPAVSVAAASRELVKQGQRVQILTTDLSRPARARHDRVVTDEDLPGESELLDIRIYPSQRPHRLAVSAGLRGALRREVPQSDVIHIHSLYLYPQYAAYAAAAKAGIPYVVSLRGALDPWLRSRGRFRKWLIDASWQHKMLERASAIHLASEQEAQLTADIAPWTRRYVIPNGIRWEAFNQPRNRSSNFREDALGGFEGPLVLVHGRLTRKKGLDLLIRSLGFLNTEFPDCRLALVGPDDEGLAQELASVAAEAHVADRVHFCGMRAGPALREALFAADVWALPSHTENFAVAAVEAMAAGCSVVMSPTVGIAEEAGRSGAAVVSRQDPALFAEQIAMLLRDDDSRRSLGAKARSYARQYDWSLVAPKMLEMYEGLTG